MLKKLICLVLGHDMAVKVDKFPDTEPSCNFVTCYCPRCEKVLEVIAVPKKEE